VAQRLVERCLACEAVVNKGEVVTSDEAGNALFRDKANRHKIELRQNEFWNALFPCSPRPRKRGALQRSRIHQKMNLLGQDIRNVFYNVPPQEVH
jgi:hypothetical protein